MSKTPSQMVPLGTLAPEFCLIDVRTQKPVHFTHQQTGIATVVMFICNHCPYVKHVIDEVVRIANDYIPKNIYFYAINANDVSRYPDDSPEHMAELAKEQKFPFPYLFDETQEVATAYSAACTPDFFVYDAHNLLAYRGQLDDSRPGNALPVTGESLRMALDCSLANKPMLTGQRPSLGCNIKWFE